MFNSLQPHELQSTSLPCPSLSPVVCLNSHPLSQWWYPTILISSCLFSSVQLLSHVWLSATSWTPALQASLSVTNSWSLLKLMYIYSVMSSKHLILCWPLSTCLQSFPASGSFLMSWPFASGGQSIEVSASASVFPMNIQDLFPLGLISLQLKGFSSLLQHHSSKGSILPCSTFFVVQLSHQCMTTGNTITSIR